MSNSVIEALNAGLPVIYNPQPGSSQELVQEAGLALDESNLERTITQARERIDLLRSHAIERREVFKLDPVAGQYMAAFRSLINAPEGVVTHA